MTKKILLPDHFRVANTKRNSRVLNALYTTLQKMFPRTGTGFAIEWSYRNNVASKWITVYIYGTQLAALRLR